MPTPVSPASPPMPGASPVPSSTVVLLPPCLWPSLGPEFPNAGATGILVIALAYFSLGIAVGTMLKPSSSGRRWLPWLVAPGVVAALAFAAWVMRSFK